MDTFLLRHLFFTYLNPTLDPVLSNWDAVVVSASVLKSTWNLSWSIFISHSLPGKSQPPARTGRPGTFDAISLEIRSRAARPALGSDCMPALKAPHNALRKRHFLTFSSSADRHWSWVRMRPQVCYTTLGSSLLCGLCQISATQPRNSTGNATQTLAMVLLCFFAPRKLGPGLRSDLSCSSSKGSQHI